MKEDAQLAQELYNRQFDEFSKKQKAYRFHHDFQEKVYADYLANVRDQKILFAGCGDGYECRPAIEKGAKVVGVDISERGIELAKKNCPEAEFFVMDIEALDFEKGSFDVIVAFFVMMYKENLLAVFSEFRRVLKEGGFIIVTVPHPVRKMMKYNQLNYFVQGMQFETWQGIERFGYYRLLEDYVEAVVGAGLKLIKLEEPKPMQMTQGIAEAEFNYPHFLVFKLIKDR